MGYSCYSTQLVSYLGESKEAHHSMDFLFPAAAHMYIYAVRNSLSCIQQDGLWSRTRKGKEQEEKGQDIPTIICSMLHNAGWKELSSEYLGTRSMF